MPSISDLEDRDDKVIEDSISAPHEEAMGVEGTQTSISSSFEDNGLVNHFPSQISDFNNANFDDFERADIIEKPLKDDDFSGVPIPLCEKEDGNHECKSIGTPFHIENDKWNSNCLYFKGDPIYGNYIESLRAEFSYFVSFGRPK